MNSKLKTSVFLVAIVIALSSLGASAYASEVTGNLSSEFATLSGVVVSPPADNTPPPPSNNGGGNNGGGGNTGGGGGGSNTVNTSALTTAQKPYDTNNDDKIDVLDFNALMVHWGEKGNVVGDFDKNGVVDVFDFNALMVHWTA